MSILSIGWHPSSSALQICTLVVTLLYSATQSPKRVVIYFLLGIIIVLWFEKPLFEFLWDKVDVWGNRDTGSTPTPQRLLTLISEANPSTFAELSTRVVGNQLLFLIGIFGYALLIKHHRVMIITLPGLILGISAIWLGRRFSIYASPFIALGLAYALVQIYQLVRNHPPYSWMKSPWSRA